MNKFLLAVAAIAMMTASSAYAAPRFSASAAANAERASAGAEPASLLSLLVSALEIGFSVKSSAPAHKSARDPHSSSYQCDEQEKSDGSEASDAKSDRRASGPEPVYLAF
jgi:hypothetical protein